MEPAPTLFVRLAEKTAPASQGLLFLVCVALHKALHAVHGFAQLFLGVGVGNADKALAAVSECRARYNRDLLFREQLRAELFRRETEL